MKDTTTRVNILALCCLFFALGAVLVPLAGIQNDEALFANPIYQNLFEFRVRAFHHSIPLMVISYIGTLKTGLYWILFHIVRPSVWSLRLPMVLLGSVTIFLFYLLADKVSSKHVAFAGAALLATDQTFLLTNTFDWGPVAIEHFLLVTACLLAVSFSASGRNAHLVGAFFALGLGLWNKAIFLWALTGLLVASATVLWPEIRKLLTLRAATLATVGFLVGTSPFLIYNLKRPNATLSQNARLEVPDWNAKFIQVQSALDGRSLFGYLMNEDDAPKPKMLNSGLGKIAAAIHQKIGERRGGIMAYVAAACLLLLPLWWRSRVAWFSLIFSAATWLMMAITRDAGGSAHHTVLLWPFPHLFVATVVSALPWRPIRGLILSAVVASNLLVFNESLYKFERNGAALVFTDAIQALSDRVGVLRPPMVYVTDWGIWNTLAMLHEAKLSMTGVDDLFPEQADPNRERDAMRARVFANREAIYIGHVDGQEVFPGIRGRVERAAMDAGRSKRVIEVISDTNGRPVFEIFQLVPNSPGLP
ncbi:MAG: glycosyltransferase family 39 protein [Bryobacteraceae bacterium]